MLAGLVGGGQNLSKQSLRKKHQPCLPGVCEAGQDRDSKASPNWFCSALTHPLPQAAEQTQLPSKCTLASLLLLRSARASLLLNSFRWNSKWVPWQPGRKNLLCSWALTRNPGPTGLPSHSMKGLYCLRCVRNWRLNLFLKKWGRRKSCGFFPPCRR